MTVPISKEIDPQVAQGHYRTCLVGLRMTWCHHRQSTEEIIWVTIVAGGGGVTKCLRESARGKEVCMEPRFLSSWSSWWEAMAEQRSPLHAVQEGGCTPPFIPSRQLALSKTPILRASAWHLVDSLSPVNQTLPVDYRMLPLLLHLFVCSLDMCMLPHHVEVR